MNTDKEITSKIYFQSELSLNEITEEISNMLKCTFYVPDDEDFLTSVREGAILACDIKLRYVHRKEFFTLTLTENEYTGDSIDDLPEELFLDDYFHTLLRKNKNIKLFDNKFPGQTSIKDDDYELYVSYEFRNSKTLKELKPLINKLFYCDMQEVTKDGFIALYTQMLGTNFYITSRQEQDELYSYHITAEYAGELQKDFKQIDITSFFRRHFKFNKLAE